MKRSDALVALSREHHTALSLALRARRVASADDAVSVGMMAERVREVFETELRPHFEQEERWLLPLLQREGEARLVERTLADHTELKELVERLASPSAETLVAFADALSRHVRFEERELFATAENFSDQLAGETGRSGS